MATAEQIKRLVKYHVEHDDEKFKTVTLQIASHEARIGHDALARDLKAFIEKKKKLFKSRIRIPVLHFPCQRKNCQSLLYRMQYMIN